MAETLRPDPLTPEDAIDALLALLPGTLGHDRDILAAAENIATVALRAATPDPAEPGLRETLRAAVRESEQRGYATVTVARDDLAALLATPDPAEPCSECDAGAATEHPHTPDRAASTVEPGLHPDDEFVARAQRYRAEHEATHENEMCGGPCIVLGFADAAADPWAYEDAFDTPDRAASTVEPGLDVERLGFVDLLDIADRLLTHYPPHTIVCSHNQDADIGARTVAAIADLVASCRAALTPDETA